ncbi:MAG: GNAT family N-acetyltransferase [Armatimonadetes bacterium]|nr:GNAT family N-acetyltransferase [Armatimonadota bacterium]
MTVEIVPLQPKHFRVAIELQRLAFPPPFDENLLWREENLADHLRKFPEGQFVALADGQFAGSCSNTRISRAHYEKHLSWDETVGGFSFETFDPCGEVIYGADISVHPSFRRVGIGRAFYDARKALAESLGVLYATACRLPDFQSSGVGTPAEYCQLVADGRLTDRTLTPLLRYDLILTDVLQNYMDDPESGNAAALLEWRP